ncbi:MAG: DNA internalization-related competence protein ComEC/Rec2 [Moraxellaceae bacterium]|nr:DNA internalization-related competence protein ComEC/Rec2 [Moraxellaceae bacterium]
MLFLTLGFALGVALCQQQAALAPSWPALCGMALAGVAAWWLRSRPHAFAIMLVVFGSCAGFGWANWRAVERLAGGLPQALEGQDLTVTGYIADLPQQTERGWRFVLRTEATSEGVPAGVPARLLLSWYAQAGGTTPVLRAGERWQLRVRLRRPHGNLNPHGFDYEAWLFERNIRAVGYVRAGDNHLLAARAEGLAPALQAIRQSVRDRFQRALPDGQWRGVLSALAVGDQGAVPASQWELFARTGVTHLMSISGLHVTLIAALVGLMAGSVWRRVARLCLLQPAQRITVLAGAMAAMCYVALAGFGVPAQRTLYMLLLAALALWLRRRGGVSFALACALMLVLLIDPWAVLSAGFWLSFGAVAALLVVARSSGEEAVVDGVAARLRWRAGQWLHAQWAITLLTLPLLLGLFQQFSLVSPFANLVAIPVVSLLVTPLALMFALLPLPLLAEMAHGLLSVLMKLLQWLSALPVANWQQAAPPGWLVALCVLAALFALLPRGIPGRWTGLLCFVPLLGWSPPRPPVGSFEARVLDVGQGLAVHLRTTQGDWLFDTGARWSEEADSGDRIVLPYLRAVGARQLDGLIVSHDDIDHSGGALSVLQGMPVGWLSSSLPGDHVLRSVAARHFDCRRGEGWQRDGVRFSFLHPGAEQGGKDNDRSCALKVSSAHGSLLITGDIEAAAEQDLLRAEAERLRADVLVVPHHGSRTSSTEAFVHTVAARHAVFTTGYRNRFGHPHPLVVERYAAQGAAIWRSDAHGALHFRFASSGLQVDAMRVARHRYWQGR